MVRSAKIVALFALGFCLAGPLILRRAQAAPAGQQSPSRPPNVVFILTDNHGAWTLGCYGNKEIATPQIDALAASGLRMTRAFSSNPVCSPTRATFLTGLIPSQHGVHCYLHANRLQIGPEAKNTLAEFRSLPEILKSQGYRCGLIGKWHLGDNLHPQEGFDDYWITMPHGGTTEFYNAEIIENGKVRKEQQYLTDFWTDHAIRFLKQNDPRNRPFFLYLPYNGPYALGNLLLNEGKNRHVAEYAQAELLSFPRHKPHPWQFNNLNYINNPVSIRRVATEISGIDDGVGRVMQTLKEQGELENTIVIFAADQGWVGGHQGFFGMGDHTRPATARDGMLQIPWIISHPGHIPNGTTSDLLVSNYDFVPTLLGYLGLSHQMPTEPLSPGRDFSPVLHGKAMSDWTSEIFAEFEYLRMIRTDRWKLVRRFTAGPDELYDLQSDPTEEHNLIDTPSASTPMADLDQRMNAFFKEYATPRYNLWEGGSSQTLVLTKPSK